MTEFAPTTPAFDAWCVEKGFGGADDVDEAIIERCQAFFAASDDELRFNKGDPDFLPGDQERFLMRCAG